MEQFASPVSYVTRNAPPLLIFHGTEDEVVLIDQSHRIVEKYNETGLESQLIVLPGAGHGGSKFFTHEHLRTLTSFLNRHRSTPSD